MEDLLDILEKIAELLYQENYNQAYGFLVKCLPFFSQCMEQIEDEALQAELLQSLTESVGAMENNDYTLLADILQYDIIEKLRDC